jgi:hypothetical protein
MRLFSPVSEESNAKFEPLPLGLILFLGAYFETGEDYILFYSTSHYMDRVDDFNQGVSQVQHRHNSSATVIEILRALPQFLQVLIYSNKTCSICDTKKFLY